MTIPQPNPASTFGYLLVVEDPLHGDTGGLLIVCDRGRPLEFHCTEPVRASRAQQILFGPTLRAYLHGEQIGGALLSRAKLPLRVLLTLDEAAAAAGRSAGIETHVLNEGQTDTPESVAALAGSIDPLEPFGRVREAIAEAHRLVAGGEDRAAA